MTALAGISEGEGFAAPRPGGRIYEALWRVGAGEVTPGGRARLDALASWLERAAFADVADVGLVHCGYWLVRELRLRVARFPRFAEAVKLATFCSARGRVWAQRRTTIAGADGAAAEASATWVFMDPASGRPSSIPDAFLGIYGTAVGARCARPHHRAPAPPPHARRGRWRFGFADLDVVGHVNNAAYWRVVEERLAGGTPPAPVDVEIEHRAPTGAGEVTVLSADRALWVTDGHGQTHAAIQALPASA